MPLGFPSAYHRINEIAEVTPLIISPLVLIILFKKLANRKGGLKGEYYIELLGLCASWLAVPLSYELGDIVKQGDCAQHISRLTEIWKGIYSGEVVALKVLRLCQADPYIQMAKQVGMSYYETPTVVLTDCVALLHSSGYDEAD